MTKKCEENISTDKFCDANIGNEPDFKFTNPWVLDTLCPVSGKPSIDYIGSATSHFQAEPLYGSDGNPKIVSDWEFELNKCIDNLSCEGYPVTSKIKGDQDPKTFPHFLKNKEKYIERSYQLGENMFRLSLDFARLCPTKEDEFNNPLMAEYVKTLALIRAREKEPMLTLYHLPMPKSLLDIDIFGNIVQGGWENSVVLQRFQFYIDSVINFLNHKDTIRSILAKNVDKGLHEKLLDEGLVKYFISVNEPINCTFANYVFGKLPPFQSLKIDLAEKVLKKLVCAHDIMRDALKEKLNTTPDREPQVGVSHAWPLFDGVLGDLVHDIMNYHPTSKFERNGKHTDFLGLQYYFRMTFNDITLANIISGYNRPDGRDYSDHPDFGDVCPRGMYEVLKKMSQEHPGKEIFISEFGFSEKEDMRRPYWILETVRYIIGAKKEGIPIKGMLLWSLVNNFEWYLGMDQKFGLFDECELSGECELSRPLENGIRSREVWQSTINAITHPSTGSLNTLQTCYVKALKQYTFYQQKILKKRQDAIRDGSTAF